MRRHRRKLQNTAQDQRGQVPCTTAEDKEEEEITEVDQDSRVPGTILAILAIELKGFIPLFLNMGSAHLFLNHILV